MPWTTFAGMTEKDLSAIYAYLTTIKPIENKVEKVHQEEMSRVVRKNPESPEVGQEKNYEKLFSATTRMPK